MSNSAHERLIWRPHRGRMQTWDLCRRECGLGLKQEETLGIRTLNRERGRYWEEAHEWDAQKWRVQQECTASEDIKLDPGLVNYISLIPISTWQAMTAWQSSDHQVYCWTSSKLNTKAADTNTCLVCTTKTSWLICANNSLFVIAHFLCSDQSKCRDVGPQ